MNLINLHLDQGDNFVLRDMERSHKFNEPTGFFITSSKSRRAKSVLRDRAIEKNPMMVATRNIASELHPYLQKPVPEI